MRWPAAFTCASERIGPRTVRSWTRKRLAELNIEATEKHTDLMGRLDSLLVAPDAPPLEGSEARGLEECMAQFQELADKYGQVPGIGRTIRFGLSTHLKKPAVRAVLYEPKAKELWRTGQQLETGGHACCAMLVYQEARQAAPAPSALQAQQRLEELSADPANVAAAEACRQLRWCHERFRTAQRLVKGDPERAQELLQEIAQRSAEDSEVHREATRLLAELR